MGKALSEETAPQLIPSEEESLARIVPIRTETALTRYPFHRIAKKGGVKIKQTKRNDRGKTETTWEVRNAPGPLAYKLDTIVVNRRIDEMRNRGEIRQLLKLGSLRDICDELGVNPSGKNTNAIKEALRENAFAGITAKIAFTANDGKERNFEFNTTRYTVIFTGQDLPNGKKADSVYIELHPRYHEMLKHSRTRPLDYEYLRELPPASQRLYELLSFAMFGALKHGRPNAQMLYSEFCQSAPLSRYESWEKVRPQMWKIHKPHKDSGYIKSVEFEKTTDENGMSDWLIKYTPGRRAKHEFKEFSARKGGGLGFDRPRLLPTEKATPLSAQEIKLTSKQESLFTCLLAFNIGDGKARELVEKYPDRVAQELEAWPHREKGSVKDPASWLIRAIERGNYSQPPKVEAKRQQTAAAKKQKSREEVRQRLMSEYHAYLSQELQDLKANHTDWHEFFTQKFEEFWRDVCRNLGEDKRELMSVHFLEKFASEYSDVEIFTFDQWVKEKHPGAFTE